MRGLGSAFAMLLAAASLVGQPPGSYSPAEAQALVARTVEHELQAASRNSHPMRYLLRKASPRLVTTKEIFETQDGAVARLMAVNDRPPSEAEEQKEQARIEALLNEPKQQRRRQQNQENDRSVVLKVMRMLPSAYLYEMAGTGQGPDGPIVKFAYRPNPRFSPPDLMSQALVNMSGQIWIDPAQERMVHLEGHMQEDTQYGWGILGKLDKGGWLTLEQTDVGQHQWRIVRFAMRMNLRVLWKDRPLDTVEEMSHYTPVAPGTDYRKAIQLLREQPLVAMPAAR